MAHRLADEAGAAVRLARGLWPMTPAERAAGRFLRAPDHGGDADDPVRRIEAMLEAEEEGAPEDDALDTLPDPEAAADEQDDDTDDVGDEYADAPAIKPPVSWGADMKEVFASLPPAAQKQVAEREAQRERAVQAAQTSAAQTRRAADAQANDLLAAHQQNHVRAIEQMMGMLTPPAPDPTLAVQDPGRYMALKAQHDAAIAQRQAWLQRSTQVRQEAEQRGAIARDQKRERERQQLAEHFGERWTDPAQAQAMLTDLSAVGAELGYDKAVLGRGDAQDIIALGKAAEWKAKADKYDALQRNKAEAVRQARGLPRTVKPNAAQPAGSAQAKVIQQRRERLAKTGWVDDAAALIATRL